MTSSPRWLILGLGVLLSATQALAAPPTVDPSDIAQRQVSLAGLDLSNPQGIADARKRISLAARQLCWGFGDSRKADDHENIRRCYDQALANARHGTHAALSEPAQQAVRAYERAQPQRPVGSLRRLCRREETRRGGQEIPGFDLINARQQVA